MHGGRHGGPRAASCNLILDRERLRSYAPPNVISDC